MQLEDFNHAMLRAIYSFYLGLFALIVLLIGLLLIPLGYVSILVVRVRLLLRTMSNRTKRENFNLHSQNSRGRSSPAQLLKILLFAVTGLF